MGWRPRGRICAGRSNRSGYWRSTARSSARPLKRQRQSPPPFVDLSGWSSSRFQRKPGNVYAPDLRARKDCPVMSRANTTPTDVAGPLRVCMHVLSTGRTDGRVMREATALAGAGYDVTIVDIERDGARPAREDIDGVHFRHVIMPSRFVRPRFRPWFVAKVALAMLRGGLAVLRTPTDVVHAHDENTLPACYLAAVARGKALVFDAHELPMVQRNITSWRPLRAAA